MRRRLAARKALAFEDRKGAPKDFAEAAWELGNSNPGARISIFRDVTDMDKGNVEFSQKWPRRSGSSRFLHQGL